MKDDRTILPFRQSEKIDDPLTKIAREGARRMLAEGALSQKTAKLMVFTLIQAASKKWLRLKGRNQLPKLIEGIKFNDGIEVTDANETCAA